MDAGPKQSPVIIVGAPRSGTNLLRDCLTRLDGLGTWDCDEINSIWRYGNEGHPSDELTAFHARPEVRTFIRNQFRRQESRQNEARVVEKTCANSLRIGFVDAVFPEAEYLLLLRDGREASLSAIERWQAPTDWAYTLRKARYVPARSAIRYALRFGTARVSRLAGDHKHLRTWGPRFQGIDVVLETQGLAATCAWQWRRCVELADLEFRDVEPGRVHRVRYESLVERPYETLKTITEIADLEHTSQELDAAAASVSADFGGRWVETRQEVRAQVMPIIEPVLKRCGYPTTS